MVSVLIERSIYHDPPYPSFERTFVPEIFQLCKDRYETVVQIVFRFCCIFGVAKANTKHLWRQHAVQSFGSPVIPRNTGINYFSDVIQVGFVIFSKNKDNYRLLSLKYLLVVILKHRFNPKMGKVYKGLRCR